MNRLSPPLPLTILLLLCGGCGTGAYEERLETRVKELRTSSVFRDLGPPVDLGDTPIRARVPMVFKDPLAEGAAVDDKTADPRRTKPPVINLTGYRRTYEATIDDSSGGKLPYYCFLAAVAEDAAKDPTRVWQSQLASQFPDARAGWQAVDVPTPEGNSVGWQRLQIAIPQEFYYVDSKGQASFVKMPGILVMYYRPLAGFHVVVAWRLPAGTEDNVKLSQWEKLVAGTVTAKD